ncbi:hypothetical protein U91I_02267 [alpha proteobacterium U9-1i]|nr:hypothetical protein U91I_02267 [alpha proteobacterium U9-1i]
MSRNPRILLIAAVASVAAAGLAACGQTTEVEAPPPAEITTTDPLPPAPSLTLTEADARTRIETAGYTNVTALTQNADGHWTATATQNGASVNVMIDSTGNVTVATPAPSTP